MSILMYMSGTDSEESKVLSILKELIDESVKKGGSEEMKAVLRNSIVNELFQGDLDSWFDGMGWTEEMVDNCINELAMGKNSHILCENFWWEEETIVVSINPNTGELGVGCEDDECWCNECEEHRPYEVVPIEEMEVFDGKLGVRFEYKGKVYEETIIPAMAESDPDLENVWRYSIDSGDENVRITLLGNYLFGDGDNDALSTTQLLQVKVEDAAEGETYIDDIDII